MRAMFQTDNEWTGFILRVTLGLVMLPHGAQKLLGLFGGFGFSGTMGFFTQKMGLPWLIAFLVIIGESFGQPWPAGRVSHQVRGGESGRYHVGSRHHGASAERIFYELVRTAAG